MGVFEPVFLSLYVCFIPLRKIEGLVQTSVKLSAPPIFGLFKAVRGGLFFSYAFTLFLWDGGSFQYFGQVRMFCIEEHSIGSRFEDEP